MDVDKEIIVREYPLPPVLNSLNPKYLLMGSHLSCIAAKDLNKTFEIYILDFVSGKWSLYYEMGHFDYYECGIFFVDQRSNYLSSNSMSYISRHQ